MVQLKHCLLQTWHSIKTEQGAKLYFVAEVPTIDLVYQKILIYNFKRVLGLGVRPWSDKRSCVFQSLSVTVFLRVSFFLKLYLTEKYDIYNSMFLFYITTDRFLVRQIKCHRNTYYRTSYFQKVRYEIFMFQDIKRKMLVISLDLKAWLKVFMLNLILSTSCGRLKRIMAWMM